jgi:hypothetical protein
MTPSPDTPDKPSEEIVEARAEDLLPEEQATGSDNPIAQAEAILEESEERTSTRCGGAPHERGHRDPT